MLRLVETARSAGEGGAAARTELEAIAAELDRRLLDGQELDPEAKAAFFQAVGVLHETRSATLPPEGPALERLARAARVAGELGMGAAQAWLELEVGYAHAVQGRPCEAIEHLERALAAAPEPSASQVETLVLSSNVRGLCGELGRSLSLAREALQAIGQLELEPLEAARLRISALCALAQAQVNLGLTDRAAATLAEARENASTLDDPRASFDVACSSILLAQASEDYDAIEDEVRAVSQGREGILPWERSWLLHTLGLARAERERMDPARPRSAAATLAAALEEGDLTPAHRIRAQLALARVQLREGRWREAEALLRDARNGLGPGALRSPALAHVAALSASVALERGASPAELERELTSFMRDVEPFLAQWASAPLRRGGIAFMHFGERRAVVADLVRLILAVRGPERGGREALELLWRLQAYGTLARELEGKQPIALDAALRLTSEARGLLIYLSGFDRSYVFAIDAARTSWEELPAAFEIERRRIAWLSELATPDAGDSAAATRERDRASRLAEALLPAAILERVQAWSELLIDGQESLGYVPFELLPDGAGSRIGLEKPLAYLPSLRVGALLARRSERRGDSPAIELRLLAAPLASPRARERFEDLAPIPWDPSRSLRLQRLFRRAEVLTGREATAAALERERQTPAQILELIAHGVSDYERERPPGLVLSPSTAEETGLVWCEDIERLAAPPLVVLATCGAARGPLRRGDDGASHMGGAFLRAGADAVLLSPVDLELEPTLALLDELHRGLALRGESPAQALLAARRRLARDGRPPAEYGLFHLLGLGSEPVYAPLSRPAAAGEEPGLRASLWALALLGGVIAASSLWIFAARRREARR